MVISLPMADDADQVDVFASTLSDQGQTLNRARLTTLQINVGKMCNLACHHCHVEAGPTRQEIMTRSTMERILDWIDTHRQTGLAKLETIDLTGGAPEMNPDFEFLVRELRERQLQVIDRSNLTILLQPGYEHMVEFLSVQQVQIIASLPCYLEDNVDQQRGKGVYDESIEALQRLNRLGYGQPDSGLTLHLVYNPVGFGLPGSQQALERDYKRHLQEHFGIVFNHLLTITNMPIKRFAHALRREGQYQAYMDKLIRAHDPANAGEVMCRSLVSVGWQGSVYDCDFNQMLLMPIDGPESDNEHHVEANSAKLWDMTPEQLIGKDIRTDSHCFGCTAGAGSSCTGALASTD